MFSGLNVVNIYKDRATEIISADRKKYDQYFKIIEEYITEPDRQVIIGGISAYKILINKPLNPNEYQYNLFAKDPWRHAREIATAMFRTTSNIYIYTKTKIANADISIFVDERELVTIGGIENQKGADMFKQIAPLRRKGLFTDKEVYILSPEIILIDIYRQLYMPLHVKKWEELGHIAQELYKLFIPRYEGALRDEKIEAETSKNDSSSSQIHEKLMKLESSRGSGATTSSWAAKKYGVHNNGTRTSKLTGYSGSNKRIYHLWGNKYVSSLSPTELASVIDADEYREQSDNLMIDFRMRRVTYYIAGKPVAYIYNCMQYDIMNDSSYTRLRFYFLELWHLRIVRDIGALPGEIASRLISDLIGQIVEENEKVLKLIEEVGHLAKELFPSDYFGVYYDEIIAKKQYVLSTRDANSFNPPNWYPASVIAMLDK
jgi:hypothetical protein